MTRENSKNWQLNRQINISVIFQLVLLASLIVGSWINLQRQLDLLQYDVTMLLENNKQVQCKLEQLTAKSITYEFRLKAVEKTLSKSAPPTNSY